MKLTNEMAASRISEDDLRPIVEHFAKAAQYSKEAFLELAMAMPHIKRLLPDWDEAVGNVMTGAFQSWQTIEEAGDEALGSQIVDLMPTGKPLPALPQP